ncbi:GNAT superfamily N-acetyltransferase [Janthinobacterium sp. CG_23.3]|uniref:GNAT family N-acetyltransferase n=1 Tax=unclassified Janthinobacterium TaxID=2610881 RepID=UPI0004757A2E|nr:MULTISPECIES: GNAT family N-acetyltransferase [unclassified Janthinobacterium]MEC5160601.1 GNAT superfamily N-acetyltransferase [Janthinobacterium sp. CG_S6]
MSLEIRIATSTDAFEACGVLRRSITECCRLDHQDDPAILEAWLGNKTPQMVAGWFASPTNFSLVAVESGAVVGVALLTRAGKLALCYLLPEARRQGVGRALLARTEAQAREWGIKALQLHSTATAESFYAGQGYSAGGSVKSSYGVETIFFWKQLDAGAAGVDAKRKRFCNCNNV